MNLSLPIPSLYFAATKKTGKTSPQIPAQKWETTQSILKNFLKDEGPNPQGSIVVESRTEPGQYILLPEGQSIVFLDSAGGTFVHLDKEGKLLAALPHHGKNKLNVSDYADQVNSFFNCLNNLGRRKSDNLRFIPAGDAYTQSWLTKFNLPTPTK